MAIISLEKKDSVQNFLDQILPPYGKPSLRIPIWDDAQKMFVCEQYTSKSGNLYYKGIRFCNRIVMVEKIGQYHNWTYIDSIELYSFDKEDIKLIQKQDYENQFYDKELIRRDAETMVQKFLAGVYKIQGCSVSEEEIEKQSKGLLDECYKNFLDNDYNTKNLEQILQVVEQKDEE